MNIKMRSISIVSALGLLLASAPIAKADIVGFSVWENGITNLQNTPEPGDPLYGQTPNVTGTVSNNNPANLFSFFLSNTSNDVSLNGFLTFGGDTVGYTSGSAKSGDSINQSVFEFTGDTELTAGTTYSFTKDDGMILVINGVKVIDAGNATAAQVESFTASSTGTYSFQLYYDETNGAPAELEGALSSAPEPSSFVLLGSGLLGAAGMLRRRMKV